MTSVSNQKPRVYRFKALTHLWTGDARGQPGRLIATGLLGSLRWWFEVLVRGLGGRACDPTHQESKYWCLDDRKKPGDPGHHCVVCELFGCTGWARKFRFEVLYENSGTKADQIKQNQTFSLCFTPLRPIRDEEWALLEAALRLIADYGAIGGKTVFKPTDEPNRTDRPYHKDYGLVRITEYPKINRISWEDLKSYLSKWLKPDHGDFDWASLQHFWCVKGKYLARQNNEESTFNRVIGRPEPKSQSSQNDSWIAGRRPDKKREIDPESKKVFSFKEPKEAARTFGFVEKTDDKHWDHIKNSLNSLKNSSVAWKDFDPSKEFLTGNQILKNLFDSGGPK